MADRFADSNLGFFSWNLRIQQLECPSGAARSLPSFQSLSDNINPMSNVEPLNPFTMTRAIFRDGFLLGVCCFTFNRAVNINNIQSCFFYLKRLMVASSITHRPKVSLNHSITTLIGVPTYLIRTMPFASENGLKIPNWCKLLSSLIKVAFIRKSSRRFHFEIISRRFRQK